MARRRSNGNTHDAFMARALDDLAQYDTFAVGLLPQLKELLAKGASAEDIYAKFAPMAAARAVMVAMMDVDSGKALAAAKDMLDRDGGKAKERSEVTHKYSQLPDNQLDSLILSELGGLEPVANEKETETGTQAGPAQASH